MYLFADYISGNIVQSTNLFCQTDRQTETDRQNKTRNFTVHVLFIYCIHVHVLYKYIQVIELVSKHIQSVQLLPNNYYLWDVYIHVHVLRYMKQLTMYTYTYLTHT